MHTIHDGHFWPEFDRVISRSYRSIMPAGLVSPLLPNNMARTRDPPHRDLPPAMTRHEF
jgi:hypothetical protein